MSLDALSLAVDRSKWQIIAHQERIPDTLILCWAEIFLNFNDGTLGILLLEYKVAAKDEASRGCTEQVYRRTFNRHSCIYYIMQ